MNSQINDIIKSLTSIREERIALELKISQLINAEDAIKKELTEIYEIVGKANEIIDDINSKNKEADDREVSEDMEKAGSIFRRNATECPGISIDVSGTLYHRDKPLTKLDVDLSNLYLSEEFDSAFSWTCIKLIKINNLYVFGDDLTSILTVILKSKPLKLLCKGAGTLNKTVAAMESKGVNYIKEDPTVVLVIKSED